MTIAGLPAPAQRVRRVPGHQEGDVGVRHHRRRLPQQGAAGGGTQGQAAARPRQPGGLLPVHGHGIRLAHEAPQQED